MAVKDHQERKVTAAEAGLSIDEQINIALDAINERGGTATMDKIIAAIEERMKPQQLSHQGIVSLRYFLRHKAIEQEWVLEEPTDTWHITSKGQKYAKSIRGAPDIESGEDEDTGVEEEDFIGDTKEPITDPYDPTKISVVQSNYPVFQIMRKIELKEIDLQPDFQRRFIWDDTRQSRLIESILIHIPLPVFYVDASDPNKWLVIDGLQRLNTLNRFVNHNKLKLTNLEFLTDLEESTYEELPRSFQRDIEDTQLYFYLVQPGTPANVKFTVFSRVNTGGLILKAQEIRHALFQGKATELLQDLADSEAFLEATTGSISPKRMDDRECVLRFLAFDLNSYENYQQPDFNRFLVEVMEVINDFDDENIEELRHRFREAMEKAWLVFREYAFRKMYGRNMRRYPINKALFEVWSVLLRPYPAVQLEDFREPIIDGFIDVMNNDEEFVKAISQGTGSVSRVRKRFRTIEDLLERNLQ